ncbi:Phosphatidylcholine-sterol acyltransferase [Armadillidium vulgare]|nr:Phosphatidylcholine-sterol acyltransferase [Armadillidium vulgare]
MASLAFLMPSRNIWHEDEVLVETPAANYSLSNISEYFKVVPYEVGYEMYKDTKDMLYNAPPPGVEIHCLHGVQLPTTERVIFKENGNFSKTPTLIRGDGDGTVNTRSLQHCLQFRGKQKQEVHYKTFEGVEHLKILWSFPALQYITSHMQNVGEKNMLRERQKHLMKHRNYENSIYSLDSNN